MFDLREVRVNSRHKQAVTLKKREHKQNKRRKRRAKVQNCGARCWHDWGSPTCTTFLRLIADREPPREGLLTPLGSASFHAVPLVLLIAVPFKRKTSRLPLQVVTSPEFSDTPTHFQPPFPPPFLLFFFGKLIESPSGFHFGEYALPPTQYR